MAAVAFYHLTRSSATDALPALLAKTLAAEKKALVCCAAERFGQFSTSIWSNPADSWLPHGMAGKDDDDAAMCPIWITDTPDVNANEAGFLFFLDGLEPQSIDAAERVFVLFDGHSDDAVSAARKQWKTLMQAGHELSYWQQDDTGKWSKAA